MQAKKYIGTALGFTGTFYVEEVIQATETAIFFC